MNNPTIIVPKGFADQVDPNMPLLSGSLNERHRQLRAA
jgi:hypothetical protein